MKKPYLMNITETKTKQIIVWAEDRETAVKTTEGICEQGSVNMDDASFKRNVFVQFKANDYDLDIFEQYCEGVECEHYVEE